MINPPLPSGIGGNLPLPTDKDKLSFPIARDCIFVSIDPTKPLNVPLPKDCKTALPANGKLTVEFKNRFFLFGVTKPIWRDGAQIRKGWVGLFPVNTSKPETPAKVVIIPGKKNDYIFSSADELNKFLFDAARDIAAAPKLPAAPKPVINPLAPAVPNFYPTVPNFHAPATLPNQPIKPFNMTGSLLY